MNYQENIRTKSGQKMEKQILTQINKMKPEEVKKNLAQLVIEQERKKQAHRIAVSKSGKKRYASQKELKAIKEENEKLQRQMQSMEALQATKEMTNLNKVEQDRYISIIEDLLYQIVGEGEEEQYEFYESVLKANGLHKPSTFNYEDQQRNEYKKIIRALKDELRL